MTDSATDPAADPQLIDALRLHQAGRLEEAEAAYTEILVSKPDHVDALHLLTTLRLQQGRAADALALADKVIALAPDAADAHGNRGTALQALQRTGEAATAFRRAIFIAPDAAHHHYNLGNALRADGDKSGAAAAYRQAVTLAPGLVAAQSNLGATLSELGLFEDAAAHCLQAVEQAPDFADGHYNLGNAYREQGRFDDAVASYQVAIRLAPDHADALCNLGLTLMRATDLSNAIDRLSDAVAADPDHRMAAFYRAVAMEMMGRNTEPAFAALDQADPTVAAWCDSWDYVKSHSDMTTEIIHDPFRLLSHALAAAKVEGMTLEFGVRHGVSIRHIAAEALGPVHGFDSFRGLPAAWGGEPAGVYSTDGRLPEVPANVTLHEGLFEDTLAPFLAAHSGPVRFCNIDCDIHTSTVTVLQALAPRIVPGTVLVFDEYLVNPTWREDEFRAFQEAVTARGWRYRYLAFGIVTKQAAVIIDVV